MTDFIVHEPAHGMASRCEPILRALPDWFGIEDSVDEYVACIDDLPTLIVTAGEADIGFLSLKLNGEHSADAYVLGVLDEHHRGGVGRAMFVAAERWLAGQGIRFLQVKTVGESHSCVNYEKTRQFYMGIGFTELETFETMHNWPCPCLIMIKAID